MRKQQGSTQSRIEMMNSIEHEVLKDIPGYKAILKAVLKSQIQTLVEQLAEETEEETVLLSVSTSDGTLSHLGSIHGKDFLQDKDDIKFQFLTHCLKKKHSPALVALDNSVSYKDNHSTTNHDLDRENGNLDFDQEARSEQTPNHMWEQSNNNIPPESQKSIPLDNVLHKSQEDFPDVSADFSETLTVNGEQLIVQTNPVNSNKRKRKRKPSYIPTSQRIKVPETELNVKVEGVEGCFTDGAQPTALDESGHISSQVNNADVSVKTEPDDDMDNSAPQPTDDSLVMRLNDTGYQPDMPITRPENSSTITIGGIRGTPHTCLECGMVYSCASGLHYHMKIHNRNLQVCNRCGYKCVRKTQLLAHIFKHHDPTGAPFCYICQKMFSRTDKLTEHNRKFHRGEVNTAWKQVAPR